MLGLIIQIIQITASVYTWLIIIAIVMSYFVSPYHPIRRTLDGLINPLLNPIRKVVPPLGGFDFSPIVLVLLVRVVEILLVSVLMKFGS
ncbi:MAG: hypothetical protein BGO78_01680 [Chloroflexi bacterium 44-23]|nr:MAG: hypothetical protein BGO78_01680 [Chloroflexi bacterium 44-23]